MKLIYGAFISFCLPLATYAATAIPRTTWTYTADSSHAGNEVGKAFDGDSNTFWHSEYTPSDVPLPHTVTIDMKQAYVVNGFSYQPRQDSNNHGFIAGHTIELSMDSQTWTTVVVGTYPNDMLTKATSFSDTAARYVRLTATSEVNGNPWTSAAEINVLSADPTKDGSTFQPPSTSLGKWALTIDFPIVPAAVAMLTTGKLLTWSAFKYDEFGGGTGKTQTSTWNPSDNLVSQREITNTAHDMFCPGISIDATGRPVVTGGNDNPKTSIYNPSTDAWVSGSNMVIGRGYQSQVTLSDGRIFTIGGSWSGARGGKDGEIYNTGTNVWTKLAGCLVAPMLTVDNQGIFREDNHGWLFAWKSNTVFQAGPSKAMNWYGMSGSGSTTAAGNRATDQDSMNGVAIMYDAINGKILTAGGAQNYQTDEATSNAHLITIGTPNTTPTVETLSPMAYRRGFHNGVVLPNGKVLIIGGQSHVEPFTDDTAALVTEMWDPATKQFTSMAPIAVPRTYHSVAVLLPDGTVFSGGGGLCGTCTTNHFDGQIYYPPYLFNSDGTRATRPTITSVSTRSFRPGTTITVQTDIAVSSFSLIRYGSATHTVNTDQRRVPLAFSASGTTYTITVPSDAGIMIAGPWMLFALTSSGVPSVSMTVTIQI